jgi:hypothetical protein
MDDSASLLHVNSADAIFHTKDGSTTILLDPRSTFTTSIFHCLYKSWVLLSPYPENVLKEMDVVCMMHNKYYISPEHEFLVIETKDQRDNIRLFILERTVSNQQDEAPIEPAKCPNIYKKMKQFTDATYARASSHSFSEFLTSESVSTADNIALSSVKSAASVSNSLDRSPNPKANDGFLGQDFVFMAGWQGENI